MPTDPPSDDRLAKALEKHNELLAEQNRIEAAKLANQPLDPGRLASAQARALVKLAENEPEPVSEPEPWTELTDEFWEVRLGGIVARWGTTYGFRFIHYLVNHPYQEISARDLRTETLGEQPADHTAGGSHQSKQDVIDDRARHAITAKIEQLEEDADLARQNGEPEAAREADDERQGLLTELGRQTGLFGKPRSFSDDDERTRKSVQRVISTALANIRKTQPRLADYLDRHLRRGKTCVYRPPPTPAD